MTKKNKPRLVFGKGKCMYCGDEFQKRSRQHSICDKKQCKAQRYHDNIANRKRTYTSEQIEKISTRYGKALTPQNFYDRTTSVDMLVAFIQENGGVVRKRDIYDLLGGHWALALGVKMGVLEKKDKHVFVLDSPFLKAVMLEDE